MRIGEPTKFSVPSDLELKAGERPSEETRELIQKRLEETGEYEDIIYEKSERIATITMNRPHRRNAKNQVLGAEWRHALDDAFLDDSIRVIILTGTGAAFCSGDDIKDMWANPHGGNMADKRVQRLKSLPRAPTGYASHIWKPIIAAIPGVAIGAGLVMVLEADIRISDENGALGWFFVRRGIPTTSEPGGLLRLLYIMGLGRAMEFMLSGELMGAEEALKLGLVDYVVPKEKLMDEARAKAHKLMKDAMPLAQMAIKQLVDCAMINPAGLRDLSREFGLWQSRDFGDFKEAFTAFTEKRPQVISEL